MQIAIIGYRRSQREAVAKRISECLGRNSPYTLRQYGLDEPKHNPPPTETAAVFAIVDDGKALNAVLRLGAWGKDLPLVIVGAEREYTLEDKLVVKCYLPLPPTEGYMREALRSIKLEAAYG